MIYLDNAATTFPKPECVIKEVTRCMSDYCGNPGRGSHRLALAASDAIYEARERLSRLFGADDASGCVFTLNTTYALNLALKSLVNKGDHILISDLEHNSVFRQVYKLKKDGVADYSVFKTRGTDNEILSDISAKTRENTAIIICLILSNVSRKKLPAERIGNYCKSRGIIFIADGAQSAGTVECDAASSGIDALCVPSHKGLYGPQGCGAVLFSERVRDRIRSVVEGGSGSNSLSPDMPRSLPDGLEAGTLPTPAVVGMRAGIDFVLKTGVSNIARHEGALADLLSGALHSDRRYTVYDYGTSGGVVLFNVKGKSPSDVATELDKYGICVRAGFHCAPLAHKTLNTGDSGAVRVSFGVFNDEKDVKSLLDALCLIK